MNKDRKPKKPEWVLMQELLAGKVAKRWMKWVHNGEVELTVWWE